MLGAVRWYIDRALVKRLSLIRVLEEAEATGVLRVCHAPRKVNLELGPAEEANGNRGIRVHKVGLSGDLAKYRVAGNEGRLLGQIYGEF